MAGSRLENLIFGVTNIDGEIDKSIHNEEKYGQLHGLTIKSESLHSDDSVYYTFQHGRCVVPAVTVPGQGESFCLVAAHSCYHELRLSIQLRIQVFPKFCNVCIKASGLLLILIVYFFTDFCGES